MMISNFPSRRRSNESDSSAKSRSRIPSHEEQSMKKETPYSKLSKISENNREAPIPANELLLAQKVLQDARSQREATKYYSQRSRPVSGEEEYRKALNLAAFESLPKLYHSSTFDSKKESKGGRSTDNNNKMKKKEASLVPQQKSLSSRQLTSKKNKDKDDKKVNKIMNELKIHHRVLETYYKSKKENENTQEQNQDRSINKLIETFLDSYEHVMSMTTRQGNYNSRRRGSDHSTESSSSCLTCSSITDPNMVAFDRAHATSKCAPPPRRKSEQIQKKRVSFGLPSTLKNSQEQDKKRGSSGGEIKGILRKNSFIYKQSLTNKCNKSLLCNEEK